MSRSLIPALDPTPIPGPAWLFHVLLVFTFVLHALFMNLALGGTIIAAVGRLLSGGRAGDPRSVLADRLMAINTYAISLAITTGIAPLLFVQVLYQQYFYTATILIAWVWLLFLVFLMVGYYAAYADKFTRRASETTGGGWLALSAVMFLLIAMVHVAVNLIHSQPGKWAALAGDPWRILADAAYFPRLLHFVVAALGFSALVSAWWAVRRAKAGHDVEINSRVAGHAWRWALWTTVLQVIGGFVLLLVLPRPVVTGLMEGGIGTLGPLALSIMLGVGLLMMLSRVSDPVDHPGTVHGTLTAMLLAIAVMSVTRHQVRELYLAPHASQAGVAAAPQWGNFALFALLFVAGLATVGYMVRQVRDNPASGDEAA